MTSLLAEKEKFVVPEEEYIYQGHTLCAGCSAALIIRYVLKVLGPKTICVVPACCFTLMSGRAAFGPDSQLTMPSGLRVSVLNCAFETAAVTASGVKAGLEAQGDYETTVLAVAGDGGTFDIGLQALSGAAERNDDIMYLCYDNEAYMNTGIQRSSATPDGCWTTTTPLPSPKQGAKKNIMEIIAAHKVPYAATATPAFPFDLMQKVSKAKQKRGTRFFHVLCPCPTGWRFSPEFSIKLGQMAVESKVFPLYEIEDGEKYTINYSPGGVSVRQYLELQGRFRHLMTEQHIARIQENVDHHWERLIKRVQA